MKYTVVIVDDEKLVINSLALAFPWEETAFEVIATFQNSRTALEEIKTLRPDVVFSDIKMPGMDGLKMMEELRKALPSIRVVFISGHEEFSYARQALQLGADGYCLKPLEDEEIMEVLDKIRGELEEGQTNMEALFYRMLQNPAQEGQETFLRLFHAGFPTDGPYYMAASIQDMQEELRSHVSLYRIKYEKNTFFYFFEDGAFLKTPRFLQKVRQSIHGGKIKGFAYTWVDDEADLGRKAETLINASYHFFIYGKDTGEIQFDMTRADWQDQTSGFFKSMEELYGQNKIKEMLDCLKNYETLYLPEERTVTDAMRIYNLVMTSMFRRDGQYFEEQITRPYQLADSFSDLADMINYLTETAGNQLSGFAIKNPEMIKNSTFREILNYINQNYCEPISFQNICKEHAMNPSYLSQVFQREIGTTFTNYLTGLRVGYARELLESTSLTISEISDKVGYDQYFYFSKIFKKIMGLSPRQYRDEIWKNR